MDIDVKIEDTGRVLFLDGVEYSIIYLPKEEREKLDKNLNLKFYIKKKCDNPTCNTTYFAPLLNINRGFGRFCSHKCVGYSYQKGRKSSEETKKKLREIHTKPDCKEIRICQNPLCKKSFMVQLSSNRPGKFCSHGCSSACHPHSDEVKIKIGKCRRGKKGTPFTEERKKNARLRVMNYYIQRGKIGPLIGKNETMLLNAYEEENKCKLLRQHYIKELCYFVDGYCKETNTVVEVYEEHHNVISTRIKDLKRQKRIEEFLQCCFVIIYDKNEDNKKVA
jgi:hypothetical protein